MNLIICLKVTWVMVHWREESAVSVHREDKLEAGGRKETGSCCKVKFGKTAVPYIGRIAAKGDHFIAIRELRLLQIAMNIVYASHCKVIILFANSYYAPTAAKNKF